MGGFVGVGVPVISGRAIRAHGRNQRPWPGRASRARRRHQPGFRAAGRALGLALPAALSLLALGCCAPKVVRFEASPVHVAPGGATTLRWEAKGSVTLSAAPPTIHDGPVEPRGELSVVVTAPTTFRLEVTKCGSTVRAEQSITIEAGVPSCCTAEPGTLDCEPGGVVASVTLPEADWGALRVGSVRGRNLPLTIDHAGRSGDVAPGSASEAFRGTTYAGLWRFHYRTPAGRACPSPDNAALVLGADVLPDEAR
jgi:hypothetical protein